MEIGKSENGISVKSKSPVREAIEHYLDVRGEQIAAYYKDAIQNGMMSLMDAREAFTTAMNAEYCICLPDIMADIPTYVIAMPNHTRTINPEKEKKAQAVIDRLLYSPIGEWERMKEITNSEAGHTGTGALL
jgi:hypothetical protein